MSKIDQSRLARLKRNAAPDGPPDALHLEPTHVDRGVENLARLNSAGETQPEPERPATERAPGQFVSDDLQSDTVRFLEEIQDVVRRRWEAGLSPRDR